VNAVEEVVVTEASRRWGPARRAAPIALGPAAQANTERYPDATPNPVHRVADDPVSTFSIDVDTTAYSNVRRFVGHGMQPPRDAVRVEELVNYFDYGYARPTNRAEPFAVSYGRGRLALVAPGWPRQIVHIGLQGYELPAGERKPLNLTFLVDVSGSMDSRPTSCCWPSRR
jgi:Ca-activated chloride channel family protein